MTGSLEGRKAPVSVVVPCHRCAATIDRAVTSIAAQTLLPAEVVLVEDGSRDGTLERLRALAATHAPGWIRIVALPENRGAADARNAGWAAATQAYIAFLDADDAWHPRKIELQYGYMSTHPEVALCGHGYELRSTPEIPHALIPEPGASRFSRLSLLLSNRLVTPTVMLNRALPHRFHPGRRHVDDHLLWLQIQRAGLPVTKLSAVLTYVYKPMYGAGGLSSQMWEMEKAELENYRILRREGSIGLAAALALCAWSFAKFARRLVLVTLRRTQRRF
jgi:glycosyltransferase involved in cell wall biosynthesis